MDQRGAGRTRAVDDHGTPGPRVGIEGRRVDVDFPSLQVGVAEYDDGPTGCTVLALDRLASVAIDVRGGMPGVFNASLRAVEAVCLAGGSILGLEAAAGVAAARFASRGHDPRLLPLVTGGVIYDFAAPGRSGVYPDAALGQAALQAAVSGHVPVGPVGAGRSATCGKLGRAGWAEPGGQGAAFGTVGDARIVAVVVVNALGVIVDRAGQVVRGNRNPDNGERSYLSTEDMAFGHERQKQRFAPRVSEATTLTVVITDARLGGDERTQLARQIHASLARAIHPFHCTGDGDALWLLTTNEKDPNATPTAIGAAASELAWDAVLNAVAD
jgi:L-aminopeptidase/D-esterase-like protein